MKKLKMISITLIYLFLFTILPINFFIKNVQAFDGYVSYNKESTNIGNKYNIKGKVLRVKEYKDLIVALTYNTLYFIKDDKVNKYDLENGEVLSNTTINRVGDYLYLSPYKKGRSYEILSVNIKKMTATSEAIDDYIKIKNYNLQEVTIDCNGNKWFSVYDKDNKEYVLLELENGSNSTVRKIDTIENEENINYKKCITDLKVDSNEVVWFKIIENNKYKLKRVSTKSRSYIVTFENDIKKYVVDKDGSIWAISGDVLIHKLKGGTILDTLKGINIKDITLDSENNLWILDNDRIKKVVNGKIREMYNVSKDSNFISVQDDKNLSILNNRGISIVCDGKIEDGTSDSYVRNSALVLEDSNFDIRILSDNYDVKEDNKQNDDSVLEVVLNNSKFTIKNKVATNFANYSSAKIYNNDVYFVQYNTLYTIKNNYMQEYIIFNKDRNLNEFASEVEFDNNGNIYILGKKHVYFIDTNKSISKIELSKINKGNVQYENNLLKDKRGDIYLVSKSNKDIELNKLEGSKFRNANYRSQDGLKPVNVFLNEENNIEFVYSDNRSIFKVYKLDENLLPEEDIRFSNEGLGLVKTYDKIRNLKKTCDGKLILWVGKNMVYIKENLDDKFKLLYDIEANDSINSMVKGKDGRVYIGTYLSGVLSYGEKVDLNLSNYENKEVKNSSNVFENKEWIVKFNKELDKRTINDKNIIVVNKKGEKHPIKVILRDDKYSITLKPLERYKYGEEYSIIIKDVKSKLGRKMKKGVLSKFNIVHNKLANVDFKIIEPQNMDIRNKSFMEFIVDKWVQNIEKKAQSKGELLKVGRVYVNDVKVASDTGYISFSSQIITQRNEKIIKNEKDFNLNCKKSNGVWEILD